MPQLSITFTLSMFGYVARLDNGVPARDALHLMVDTYEGRRPMASWRRPPGHSCNVWLNKVQKDANDLPLSVLWRSELGKKKKGKGSGFV